ncbi:RNA polymerase sigma-28 factor precursor [uncultured Eubacterium sp.]|nr:RNA polymerase sigma-28 factor precursor [uncultured Eubacterium sp.]
MQEFLQPLSPQEERRYLLLSRQGDLNARNLLVEHNLRLVAHIVKKYHNLEREKEDMISIGTIGLIKAINTYDINKGHRLVTYAARCIENELLMMLRQEKKTSKNTSLYEPIGIDKEGNEIHLLDILGTQETDLIKKIEQKENIKRIYEELEKMEMNKEKKTLIMRYGLYGREPMTQKEVAKKLHISRSYVSRIEKKALMLLKSKIKT